MIGSAQSAQLVNYVILTHHTACLAPPNVTILRMYTSSESHFLLPAKRLALRMVIGAPHCPHVVDTGILPSIIFGGSAHKYDWE